MLFCDLECKYASFPDSDALDGSRSCRTFIGLYCGRKKRIVHKNMPCADKEMNVSGGSRKKRAKKRKG